MVDEWGRAQLIAGGFRHVVVEIAAYDGPRAGLVDDGGDLYYFDCPRWAVDEYLVWPAPVEAVALEREGWEIFVRWNRRYESAPRSAGPHPGDGGVDARHDELEGLLVPYRQAPADARRMVAEWRLDGRERYRVDGTDSWVRWDVTG
ncbi:MAG TPA: hypothetical protein VFH76_15690 [Kribbella sp.]|nr:hypothetical protein [Kribbella sp.]